MVPTDPTLFETVVVSVRMMFGLVTTVPRLVVLFDGVGSGSLPETLAELMIVPATVGLTTMVSVAVAPGAIVPRLSVIVEPLSVGVPPWLPWAKIAVTEAGRTSVTVALVEALGPLLVTVSV